ncbi:hypothetical protein C8R43DRAFT_949480 [Mycena crocata]|nr:hypothetical protein C8R43DRAFT_949480 [Mycena crocata]
MTAGYFQENMGFATAEELQTYESLFGKNGQGFTKPAQAGPSKPGPSFAWTMPEEPGQFSTQQKGKHKEEPTFMSGPVYKEPDYSILDTDDGEQLAFSEPEGWHGRGPPSSPEPVKFGGTEEEVAEMIRKLSAMCIDDPEYAPVYYKVMVMDTTGTAVQCVRPPNAGAERVTPRPNYARPGAAPIAPSDQTVTPPVISERTTARTPITYPNTIPLGVCPTGEQPSGCFGCGLDHQMFECAKVNEMVRAGVLRHNDQNRLEMSNGMRIHKLFGENLIQAVEQMMRNVGTEAPRVLFSSVDPVELTPTQSYYREIWPKARIEEVYTESEPELPSEIEEESDEEAYYIEQMENDEEQRPTNRVFLTAPKECLPENEPQVHGVERTVPSTRTARKEIFDGVLLPGQERARERMAKDMDNELPTETSTRNNGGMEMHAATANRIPAAEAPPLPNPVPVHARKIRFDQLPVRDLEPKGSNRKDIGEKGPEISGRSIGRQTGLTPSVDKEDILNRILDAMVSMSVRKVIETAREIRTDIQELIKVQNVKAVHLGRSSDHPLIANAVQWPRTEGVLNRVEMETGGRPVVAIIDTGSQLDVVRADVAALVLGKLVDMTRVTCMNDANGGRGELRGWVDDVEFDCGGALITTGLWVSQQAPFDLLLGRPWQRGNLVSIDEHEEGTYLVFKDRHTRRRRYELLVIPQDKASAEINVSNVPLTQYQTYTLYRDNHDVSTHQNVMDCTQDESESKSGKLEVLPMCWRAERTQEPTLRGELIRVMIDSIQLVRVWMSIWGLLGGLLLIYLDEWLCRKTLARWYKKLQADTKETYVGKIPASMQRHALILGGEMEVQGEDGVGGVEWSEITSSMWGWLYQPPLGGAAAPTLFLPSHHLCQPPSLPSRRLCTQAAQGLVCVGGGTAENRWPPFEPARGIRHSNGFELVQRRSNPNGIFPTYPSDFTLGMSSNMLADPTDEEPIRSPNPILVALESPFHNSESSSHGQCMQYEAHAVRVRQVRDDWEHNRGKVDGHKSRLEPFPLQLGRSIPPMLVDSDDESEEYSSESSEGLMMQMRKRKEECISGTVTEHNEDSEGTGDSLNVNLSSSLDSYLSSISTLDLQTFETSPTPEGILLDTREGFLQSRHPTESKFTLADVQSFLDAAKHSTGQSPAPYQADLSAQSPPIGPTSWSFEDTLNCQVYQQHWALDHITDPFDDAWGIIQGPLASHVDHTVMEEDLFNLEHNEEPEPLQPSFEGAPFSDPANPKTHFTFALSDADLKHRYATTTHNRHYDAPIFGYKLAECREHFIEDVQKYESSSDNSMPDLVAAGSSDNSMPHLVAVCINGAGVVLNEPPCSDQSSTSLDFSLQSPGNQVPYNSLLGKTMSNNPSDRASCHNPTGTFHGKRKDSSRGGGSPLPEPRAKHLPAQLTHGPHLRLFLAVWAAILEGFYRMGNYLVQYDIDWRTVHREHEDIEIDHLQLFQRALATRGTYPLMALIEAITKVRFTDSYAMAHLLHAGYFDLCAKTSERFWDLLDDGLESSLKPDSSASNNNTDPSNLLSATDLKLQHSWADAAHRSIHTHNTPSVSGSMDGAVGYTTLKVDAQDLAAL